MENKNFDNQNEFIEKSENKVLKTFGIIACSLLLAVMTVIVINI